MSRPQGRRRDVLDAVFCDEIGIEYGVYGDFRLRTAYQPIFAPRGPLLHPVAVEGLVEIHCNGVPVSPITFFAAAAPADRAFLEAMCRALHLRNFPNIGVDGLDLFLNYDPAAEVDPRRALAEIRLMKRRLGAFGLTPGMLVCEITEQAAPNDAFLLALVREMRRGGMRVAVDDFGAGHSTEARVGLLGPDIVKIDGAWFAKLCRHAETRTLFKPLVSALHARGPRVLVEGIENAEHLRVALAGGADLMQGFLLGRPALAGSIFDERPLLVEDLLRPGGDILPLFG